VRALHEHGQLVGDDRDRDSGAARAPRGIMYNMFLFRRTSCAVLLGLLPAVARGFAAAAGGMSSLSSVQPKQMRCIVTGGSSGIGEAICRELGKRGAKVFVTGRQEDNLKRVAAAVEEEGGFSAYGTGDVREESDVKRLYNEAQEFFARVIDTGEVGMNLLAEGEEGVDVLVTSAGIGRFGSIEELSEDDFNASFDVNVKGTWLWARQVLPVMKKAGRGQVVFVSSVAGLRKFARCSIYGASKWAVQGIAGSLREECRGTGVKICTLCPGSVATPWWMEKERGGKDTPPTPEQLGAMLTPGDCAAACMSIIDQAKSCDIESIVLEHPPN
jgi:3-oxoacyl-[acyl-carrier protein] reductase